MKIFCIGRNYADHAAEMNSPVPKEPLVFIKPSTALLVNNKPLYYPEFTSNLHYEVEVVLRICKNGKYVQPEYALGYFDKIAVGIDFTARDLQKRCKEKGHPWEIAKGFDGSAAVSQFFQIEDIQDRDSINFSLKLNGDLVQQGNTRDLIFSFQEVIVHISRFFKLQEGDYLFTGTPVGVGPVKEGDRLEAFLEDSKVLECEIR